MIGLGGPAPAAWAVDPVTLVSVSGYGNLHAGGLVVTVSGDDNRNASVALEWRPAAGTFQAAHPLSRIDATHFAGSLFWLSPGVSYEARVTLADPEGVSGPATVTTAFQTRPDTLPEPTVRTLYVSTTGNDSNPGTSPAQPLRTIQRGATLSQAGDLILIEPGVYRETVSVPRSGTATQPIVFRGNGPGVVLDGADGTIAAGVPWPAQGNGVFSRVTGFATGHVVTEAGRLFRYGTRPALETLGAGAPGGFYFDGTTLFVKFPDGSSPATHTMHVARFEDGFFINQLSFVRVENLEIRHFGAADFGKGVYLRYSSDCAVKACRIHEIGAAGVWVKGGERHRLEDNQLWDTSIPGWPWDFTKGSSAENNGISFTDDVGRGHVVRRNTFHGTFNGIGPCGSAPPPSGVTTETDLYENVLYEHTDDAFEPEGYCANVRLWENRIRDVHMAFAVAPAAPGPVYLVRNVAYRFGNTRTSQQDGYVASALKINSGFPTPIGPLYLYHNTFLTDAPGTDAVNLLNPGFSTFIRVRNNVVAGTRYALSKVNPVVWDGNYDDFYTTDSTRLVFWQGTRYNTLAAYQAAPLGQEAQGLSAPPQLVNPASGNYTPQPGSPLIDRGLVLPGINDGYSGAAPDVGAVEAVSTVPAVSIGDVTVVEGNAGNVNVVFTVTLSAPSSQTVTVNYSTADGTATAANADYLPASGVVTFPPGTTLRRVSVEVPADALKAGTATVSEMLLSPRWSTDGPLDTYYSVWNTGRVTVNGTLTLLDTTGATRATVRLALPPGQTASTSTAMLGVPRSRAGTARFTHDGPAGTVVAEATVADHALAPPRLEPVPFTPVRP